MADEDGGLEDLTAVVDDFMEGFGPKERFCGGSGLQAAAEAVPEVLSRPPEPQGASRMEDENKSRIPTIKRRKASRGKAKTRSKKCTRPVGYNSNRSRDELRKELLTLRGQAQELEQSLTILRSTLHDAKSSQDNRADSCGAGRKNEARVWKELAVRQIEQCAAAVSERKRLRDVIVEQQKVISELQQLMFSRALSKVQDMHSQVNTIPHTLLQETLDFDPSVFRSMLQQVDGRYRRIDEVFANDTGGCEDMYKRSRQGNMRRDAEGHLYFQIYGRKVFPFDIQRVGDAAWGRFSYSVRPNESCIFSQFYDAPEDTIAELFATELHVENKKAVVFAFQVKRVYREEDRISIVWQTNLNTVKFMGRELSGATYQENGYFLIERPHLAPEGFAVLRTCYILSPTIPTRSIARDSTACALMEFVVKWMSATIPTNHQILEEKLILESVGASSCAEDLVAHTTAHRCLVEARRLFPRPVS